MLERSKQPEERVVPLLAGPLQRRIGIVQNKCTDEVYLKLMRTAYELACCTTMPLEHFSVLVKVQRINGTRLIEGKCKILSKNLSILAFVFKRKQSLVIVHALVTKFSCVVCYY